MTDRPGYLASRPVLESLMFILAAGLVIRVFGGRSTAIPGIPAGVKVDLPAMMPFVLSAVIVTCQSGSMAWAEQVASRSLRWPARFLFVGLTCTAGGVLGLAGGGSLGLPRAVLLVRTLFLIAGMAVIGGELVTRAVGVALPLMSGLLLFMFGAAANGKPRIWALPLKPPSDVSSNLVSALVFFLGVLIVNGVVAGRSQRLIAAL